MDKLSSQESKKKREKKVKTKTDLEETADGQLISIDPNEESNEEAQTKTPSGQFFEDIDLNRQMTGPEDLLSAFSHQEQEEGGERDSMALLNEILGSTSLDEGEFSQEWQEVFGKGDQGSGATSRGGLVEPQQEEDSIFLPSHLLDQNRNNLQSSLSDWAMSIPQPISQATEQSSGANQNPSRPAAVRETPETAKDLSAWFNLFADLDPLSNPDAVGRSGQEHELHNA